MKNKILFVTVLCLCSISVCGQFTCGDSLYDLRDGQKYATVLIGSDCWFKENLNYGSMVNSDSSGLIHSDMTDNSIPEKYAQGNDSNNLAIYGGLYEWAELMNYATISEGQGLCPGGWHVSTDEEWQNLIINAGGNMITSSAGNGGNLLKDTTEGFGAGQGTNSVGFSALHGGDRDGFGIFYGITLRSIFWTSTLISPGQAYHYTLWAGNDTIERLSLGTYTTGFSCRCVQDPGAGLDEDFDQIKGLLIYPNPSRNFLTIEVSSFNKMTPFSIVDLLGKTLLSGVLTSEKLNIDISTIPNGIYIIQVGEDNQQKFIVTKD